MPNELDFVDKTAFIFHMIVNLYINNFYVNMYLLLYQ